MNKQERLALLYWSGELPEDEIQAFEQDDEATQLFETLEMLSTELSAETLQRPRTDTVRVAIEQGSKAPLLAKLSTWMRSSAIPAATLCTIVLVFVLSKELSSPNTEHTANMKMPLEYLSMKEIDKRFERAQMRLARTQRISERPIRRIETATTDKYIEKLSHLRSKLRTIRLAPGNTSRRHRESSHKSLQRRSRELRMQMREIKSEMT